ncbi:hypothetical protein AAJ76_7600015524 [Vairimorpha ceranae]|uniref:Uncharacterized protein n=1 Tax=Vairimorpha ceranae TaxID=40302 RepID=A0A0F9Z9B7_9MICR|nr:hypothetical protein AAJ76_7600015524 [Vairimorpha ceranae]KKO74414.1 hypothetical protein AAJ76_7600015524 [Vairimorpha ceranae]
MLYLPTTMFFNVIIWFCSPIWTIISGPPNYIILSTKLLLIFIAIIFFGIVRKQHFIPARFCIALNFIPLEI